MILNRITDGLVVNRLTEGMTVNYKVPLYPSYEDLLLGKVINAAVKIDEVVDGKITDMTVKLETKYRPLWEMQECLMKK